MRLWDISESHLREAVALGPADAWTRVELAETLELAGRPSDAAATLRDIDLSNTSSLTEAFKARVQSELARLTGASK